MTDYFLPQRTRENELNAEVSLRISLRSYFSAPRKLFYMFILRLRSGCTYPFFTSFAQASFNVTVRLKMSVSAVESLSKQ